MIPQSYFDAYPDLTYAFDSPWMTLISEFYGLVLPLEGLIRSHTSFRFFHHYDNLARVDFFLRLRARPFSPLATTFTLAHTSALSQGYATPSPSETLAFFLSFQF